jgi:hypothetical protein
MRKDGTKMLKTYKFYEVDKDAQTHMIAALRVGDPIPASLQPTLDQTIMKNGQPFDPQVEADWDMLPFFYNGSLFWVEIVSEPVRKQIRVKSQMLTIDGSTDPDWMKSLPGYADEVEITRNAVNRQ